MNNIKKHMKNFLKDESGQGTTEYILVLVAVVGIAIAFKDPILKVVGDKVGILGGDIAGFKP